MNDPKLEQLTQTLWEELAPKLLSFYTHDYGKLPPDILLRDRNLYRLIARHLLVKDDPDEPTHH